MTITKRVVVACVPLYRRVSSFEQFLALDDKELRSLIKPVVHYNKKALSLKMMCRQIIEERGGELLARKCSYSPCTASA